MPEDGGGNGLCWTMSEFVGDDFALADAAFVAFAVLPAETDFRLAVALTRGVSGNEA